MTGPSATGPRLLVLVEPTSDPTATMAYAAGPARDLAAEFDDPIDVVVRVVGAPNSGETEGTRAAIADELAALEDADGLSTDVATISIDADEADITDAILSQLGAEPVDHVVVAAETEFSVERLREQYGATSVERVPGWSPGARRPLLHPGGRRRLVAVFGLSYLFYLAIGGFAGGLDLLTGAVSAAIVAASLAQVAFTEEPTLRRTGARLARFAVFLPVLLWEIARANVTIAYVILHPRLPIDPSTWTVETGTREGLERMVLANSITLTPGTLTVDVDGRAFTVHSLTAGGRRDLEEGRLEHLVSWVFHGRADSNVPEEAEAGSSDDAGGGSDG